jgi:hypothetical protein
MSPDYSLHTIRDVKPGDHIAWLYEMEERHRAVLTPFLRQGLEEGEKVLYIVDYHTAETILDYLRGAGLDVEPYLASGQLAVLTSDETFLREGFFDPEGMIIFLKTKTEQALAEGYTALRSSSEMTWALRGLPGSHRLMEYEARLNEFVPGSKCLLACQYDRRRFGPKVLLDALRTHSLSIVGSVLYDDFISEETLENTTKCTKGFSCLYGEGKPFCEVDYAVGDEVIFVECPDGACSYWMPFGSASVCNCPTRREIYNRYRL